MDGCAWRWCPCRMKAPPLGAAPLDCFGAQEPSERLARLPDPRPADAESRTAQNGISLARSPPEGGVQASSRRLVSSAPRSFPSLSCHLRVVSLPSTNTFAPLTRYFSAISPRAWFQITTLCHSVRSTRSPLWSFQLSLVAMLRVTTLLPPWVVRTSGSRPMLPISCTRLTVTVNCTPLAEKSCVDGIGRQRPGGWTVLTHPNCRGCADKP